MQRKCKGCGRTAAVTEFAKAHEVKGKVYYRHLCKTCYYKTKKPRHQELRKQYREYKKNCKCNRCGNQDHRVLEFHHPDPSDKEGTVAAMMSRRVSWDKVLQEIDKCEVLCANCHAIEHYEEE